jgi:hypothetical protein
MVEPDTIEKRKQRTLNRLRAKEMRHDPPQIHLPQRGEVDPLSEAKMDRVGEILCTTPPTRSGLLRFAASTSPRWGR